MEEKNIMANRFILNETSYHGSGAIQEIPNEVKARGFHKAMVCSDPDLIKFGVTKKVTDLLDEAGLEYVIYSDIKANPCLLYTSSLVTDEQTTPEEREKTFTAMMEIALEIA